MDKIYEIEIFQCTLCKSDVIKSEKCESEAEKTLLELIQLWTPEGLSVKEINLLLDFFSKNQNLTFCQKCLDMIEEYETWLLKIRGCVNEFGKLLKEFLDNFENDFYSVEKKSRKTNVLSSGILRKSTRKRKKRKGLYSSGT